jgi:ParB family chromosome partitioning protein
MESVLMSEVISESNRKYTKDSSFERLLFSVREYGIIEPPVVRRLAEGGFRVLAGRRRVEAARRLNYDRIDCIVREPEDPVQDGEIALCENGT